MTKLIRNSTAELTEATNSKMEVVQQEGARSVRRMVGFYNLDAITPNINNVGKKMNNLPMTGGTCHQNSGFVCMTHASGARR